MLQAYDTIMRCAVRAEDVAKTNIAEPFRYECLCCGEEVHIAAAESRKKAPHFRHLHGNSDKDCELYLGRFLQTRTGLEGAVSVAQKRAHSHAEILFDISQQLFYFAASFSEEKIQKYEADQCELQIKNGFGRETIESVLINRSNFAPETPVLFPLKLTSNSCLISISSKIESGKSIKSYYEILKDVEFPTLFKIRSNTDGRRLAKRHTDGIIYTETPYYAIAKSPRSINKLLNYPSVEVSQIVEIPALGGTVYGAEIVCYEYSVDLSETFQYFGYCLKKAERLCVLWPPVVDTGDSLKCHANTAFIWASFDLRPRSNISCDPERLNQEGELYEVDLSDPVRVSQSNGNTLQLVSGEITPELMPYAPKVEHVKSVVVPDGASYYRVGLSGYQLLPPGKVFLTEHERVISYLGNYPITFYTLLSDDSSTATKVLMNARQYYKVLIPFSDEMVTDCRLSKVAEVYIEECRRTGTINTKVLEYIKAGKI